MLSRARIRIVPLYHPTTSLRYTSTSAAAQPTQPPPPSEPPSLQSEPTTRKVRNHTPTAPPALTLTSPRAKFTTDEPYTVTRTHTLHLPVYHFTRGNGGTQKLTRVRKVGGALATLKAQLEEALEPRPLWVRVNQLAGQVIVKGLYKEQIDKFLAAKGF